MAAIPQLMRKRSGVIIPIAEQFTKGEISFMQPDVAIIIPVYNERDVIEKVYQDLTENLKNQPFTSEILFVNDGSKDNPEEIFKRLGARFVSHSENRGYGAAIKTGVQHSKSEYFCIIDCDDTYRAKDIARLMEHAADHPMVVGARDISLNPKLYIFTKTFMCGLLGFMFGKKIGDINSGLRVIRKDVFEYYVPMLCEGFSLTSSITYAFLLDGHSIHYIPIEYHKRMSPSKVRRWSFTYRFIKGYIDVYRYHRKKLREKRK